MKIAYTNYKCFELGETFFEHVDDANNIELFFNKLQITRNIEDFKCINFIKYKKPFRFTSK